MKIGILTLHSAFDSGMPLQAWALQEFLRRRGHEAEIINLRLPWCERGGRLAAPSKRTFCRDKRLNKLLNKGFTLAKYVYKGLADPARWKIARTYERFIKNHLCLTEEFGSCGELLRAELSFDAMIVSGPVWDAQRMKKGIPAYFLNFGSPDVLRIAYAAGIGRISLSPSEDLLFKRYLREFDRVSVGNETLQKALEALSGRDVSLAADPALLLKAEDYERLMGKPKTPKSYLYVHNARGDGEDSRLSEVAEALSSQLNLPILHNQPGKRYQNEAGRFTSIGSFLSLCAGAEYVVTNSREGVIFSLLFKRGLAAVPPGEDSEGFQALLQGLGLSQNLVVGGRELPANLDALQTLGRGERGLSELRRRSKAFLTEALCAKKERDSETFFDKGDVFRCYGCGVCRDVCPVQAISMEEDKEGFRYPVIREDLCIRCQKCKEACIYQNARGNPSDSKGFPKVYAAYHKEQEVHEASTSGGMFTAFYRFALRRGGKVAGVWYDEGMNVVYGLASDEAGCARFRGSKYVYAENDGIKPMVKQLLDKGESVLFSGSPCQIAALKSYLGRDYETLWLVELICQSALSPKIFRKYLAHLETVHGSKILRFTFRGKRYGIDNPEVVAQFASGDVETEFAQQNNLMRAFYDGFIQRPSCYVCEFGRLKCGVGDITIGDYWGIENQHPPFKNDRGVSILKINTPKGWELFKSVEEELCAIESTYRAAFAKNHTKPKVFLPERARLMFDIDQQPVDSLLEAFNARKKGTGADKRAKPFSK